VQLLETDQNFSSPCAGPSAAIAGPGKPLSWDPITTSFCMRRDRDVEDVEREET